MVQRRYSETTEDRIRVGQAVPEPQFALTLRHLLVSVGGVLLLTLLEGILWILNPAHVANGTLAGFLLLPIHTPLLLLVPVIEAVLIFLLVQRVAQPLAQLAYLRAVAQAQEDYRARYTPLQTWSSPYDVPLVYTEDNSDPTLPQRTRSLAVLELITTVLLGSPTHLVLLGNSGAGKSLFLHQFLAIAAQRRREIATGHLKLPVFLSLKYYALHYGEQEFSQISLLDCLSSLDTPGLEHIRPYLSKFFQQGRLLFLCDGLDEVAPDVYPALHAELAQLFRQNRNGLLLTCTPAAYEQSSELGQLVSEHLIPRAVFQPLQPVDMRVIVERFLEEIDNSYRADLPTAGQIMAVIEHSRLRALCDTPFYLFALLDAIGTLPFAEASRLDTRGRLLEAFLQNRLRAAGPEAQAFLEDLACVARWNGSEGMLLIPGSDFLAHTALSSPLREPSNEQMDLFARWTREQQVIQPFAQETLFLLAERAEPETAIAILHRMQDAALIEIEKGGMLQFRHSLISSALLATYLAQYLGSFALQDEMLETFPEDLALWSEPLTLWAGMLEQPEASAAQLAIWARKHPEHYINVLIASLICLGVAQVPPCVEEMPPVTVPAELAVEVDRVLSNRRLLVDLAELFMRCARHGSPELYQALFPLLEIEGMEALLVQLDAKVVSELFFQRLIEIIDEADQEALVKRLVRALSAWGSVVVPYAASLCSPVSNMGGRLRTAAINVLGGTNHRSAVDPLLSCLRDTDQIIVRRAANALVRLGPALTLQSLVQELEVSTPLNRKKPLHWIILPVLERFLNETGPARQLTPEQARRIIAALLHVQTTHTSPADVEMVQEILVNHGRLAAELDSGKIAINLLLQQLSTADDAMARNMTGTLKEVGEVATPQLLEQLESQTSEAERVRILEILASVRDLRALDTLLHLLEDPSLVVQQALLLALRTYTPECIPGLISVVLHHKNELVAGRAEQMLSEFRPRVLEPVLHALTPVVRDRTQLLVHVLEGIQDERIVPALLGLLQDEQTDVSLSLAIVEVLGESADERAVAPLLEMLANSNSLLSEDAINALSNLGDLAGPALVSKMDVPEKTPLVARIERTLLGMQPFPGRFLLQVVDEGSDNQQRHIENVFRVRGADAAQLLASNLFYPRPRVRAYIRRTLRHMDARYAVPALLEMLDDPDPDLQELVATLLLDHPRESMPSLVGLFGDPERADAAMAILLQAGSPVLPALVPALDSSSGVVLARARTLLITLVQQEPELMTDTVQLFSLSLPPQAHEEVVRVLTEDLAEVSLPALITGLEDAHLVQGVVKALIRLARQNTALRATVLDNLLQALRVASRRAGASQVLIDLGAIAVPGTGALITNSDVQVARAARRILGEIGTPAFPFIWAAHSDTSDPERREAARDIFRTMPTSVIKDELVALLTSARQEEISMALALLLERIHDEELQPGHAGEMLPALLEHVQSSAEERASLRILALFILLGGPLVSQVLMDALYADTRRHEPLVQAFLLLGQSVENDLLTVLRDASAPIQLQAEIAGILAMRTAHRDVREQAIALSEHGLWAGRTIQNTTMVLQPSQLEISLRALGGLLVGGHWNSQELQNLRADSAHDSPEREIYDTLLGWRSTPQLSRLRLELETEREGRKQDLLQHTEELLSMKAQMIDLEHDLEELQKQHQEQNLDHEQSRTDYEGAITRLTKEKQALQLETQRNQQEKQALATRTQQATQEREKLMAQLQQWQARAQQLEKENASLRRPTPNI